MRLLYYVIKIKVIANDLKNIYLSAFIDYPLTSQIISKIVKCLPAQCIKVKCSMLF